MEIMALLNTHATVKKFVHFGLSEDQAEAITEAINEQNQELATKNQLAHTEAALKSEITLIESNLKSEISSLNHKIESTENKLEAKIDLVKSDIGWLKIINIAILTIVLGIAFSPIAQNMFKAPAQEVIPVITSKK